MIQVDCHFSRGHIVDFINMHSGAVMLVSFEQPDGSLSHMRADVHAVAEALRRAGYIVENEPEPKDTA